MNLVRRVKQLERDLHPSGKPRCVCKHEKPLCVVWYEDQPKPETRNETCARCGGVWEPLVIHVLYDDPPPSENAPEEPGAEEAKPKRLRRR
jgi:hypothetical protein